MRKKFLFFTFLSVLVVFLAGRGYFYLTDGFKVDNILVKDLSVREEVKKEHYPQLTTLFYLGKGCQSYVFETSDHQYVVKFIKFQRFRPLAHVNFLRKLGLKEYAQKRDEKRLSRLQEIVQSWRLCSNLLREETGIKALSFGGGDSFFVTVFDKQGAKHLVDLKDTFFLVQRKAELLVPYLERLIEKDGVQAGYPLIDSLFTWLIAEYERGFADLDPALAQNTGIIDGKPIHIDVGQIIFDIRFQKKEIYSQELFSKFYEFRKYLLKKSPELAAYVEKKLRLIIGDQFDLMEPILLREDREKWFQKLPPATEK